MSTTSIDPGSKSAVQIESEVEETRASVSGTLDALRGKFEPRQIVEQVVDQIADYARGSGGAEFARNLGTAVRDNPLPVILIGAGIGWLLMAKGGTESDHESWQARSSHTARNGSGLHHVAEAGRGQIAGGGSATQGTLGQVKDVVSGAATDASAAVSGAASRAASAGSAALDTLSDAASEGVRKARALGAQAASATTRVGEGFDAARNSVSTTADSAMERIGGLAEEQPLLLGILGLALGAAVGAALPRTRAEDRLLGETRDAVVGRLSEATSEGYEEIRSVAGEQVGQLKDAVLDTYGKTKDRLDEKGLAGTGSALGEAASGIAQAVGGAVDNLTSHVARKADEALPPRDRPAAG